MGRIDVSPTAEIAGNRGRLMPFHLRSLFHAPLLWHGRVDLSRSSGQIFRLGHFHKCCSDAAQAPEGAVFLVFGFVSARSQAHLGMLPRQSLAKNQKSSLRTATSFLSML